MTVVIFQGSKFFWRARNTIDVTIIEHRAWKVVEVACYEPSLDVEASRVYLDSAILAERINRTQIEEKLSFAKQNNVPHTEKLVRDITHQAITEYILNRLAQTELSADTKKFEVAFQLNFRDVVIEAADRNTGSLIREPPSELTPFTTTHNKIFTEDEKNKAMEALEDAKKNLHEQCLTAMALQAQPTVPLEAEERWRIPIVLGKVAHNRRLSDEDNKIWNAVASSIKSQEDIDRITKVTLRTVEPRLDRPEYKPDPKPVPKPAPKILSRIAGFFMPVVRSSVSAPSTNQTPVRSPISTPQNSRRMMADTASSQRRANSCAEDHTPKKKAAGAKKKKTSVRRPASRQRDRPAADAGDAGADTSEASVDVSGPRTPAADSSDAALSFMNELAARLAFTLSNKRNKVCSVPQEADTTNVKDDRAPLDRAVSMERRHLGELNPALLYTSSTAPSLKSEYAHLNPNEPFPARCSQFVGPDKPFSGADAVDRSATAGVSGKDSVISEDPVPQARKRRSYLGSFLATFTGTLDSAVVFDGSAKLSVKRYPSRRPTAMGFEWLLGGRGQMVVPADPAESQYQ